MSDNLFFHEPQLFSKKKATWIASAGPWTDAQLHISYIHNLAQSSAITSSLMHFCMLITKDIFKRLLAFCQEEDMP